MFVNLVKVSRILKISNHCCIIKVIRNLLFFNLFKCLLGVSRNIKKRKRKGTILNLNAEFQRKARKDKKAFLSDQCKEIEQNNRMEKTRDLFKKSELPGGAKMAEE